MKVNVMRKYDKNSFILNKYFIQKGDLSLSAVGLLSFIQSMPDNYKMNITDVSKHFSSSYSTIVKVLLELEDKKYLKKEEIIISEKSRIVYYCFFEIPYSELVGAPSKYIPVEDMPKPNSFTERKDPAPRKVKIKEYPVNSEEYKLAVYLHDEIMKSDPGKREPNYHLWAKSFDKIKFFEGITYEQMYQVIKWAHEDKYWKMKVISPDSLKFHYGMIRYKMQNPDNNYTAKKEQVGFSRKEIDDIVNGREK